MNKKVLVASPAWLKHFIWLPAGKELFQSGPAKGMRSNMYTKAEEQHGQHGSCCAGAAAWTKAAPSCTMANACPLQQPACNGFNSTSLMLFFFHIRCEDLGWSRPAAGGSREAGCFALCCCAAILISRAEILLANTAAAGSTGQGGDYFKAEMCWFKAEPSPHCHLCAWISQISCCVLFPARYSCSAPHYKHQVRSIYPVIEGKPISLYKSLLLLVSF